MTNIVKYGEKEATLGLLLELDPKQDLKGVVQRLFTKCLFQVGRKTNGSRNLRTNIKNTGHFRKVHLDSGRTWTCNLRIRRPMPYPIWPQNHWSWCPVIRPVSWIHFFFIPPFLFMTLLVPTRRLQLLKRILRSPVAHGSSNYCKYFTVADQWIVHSKSELLSTTNCSHHQIANLTFAGTLTVPVTSQLMLWLRAQVLATGTARRAASVAHTISWETIRSKMPKLLKVTVNWAFQ